MKKITAIVGLLISSTVLAENLECKLSIFDNSDVGVVENALKILLK